MLKVFLVEDESVVRESIRDNMPWEECGFTLTGDAGDGELALSMMRKNPPDLLITDIKMPFMDGLTLCHIAGAEFPGMKKIIMSGYDDFEFARRAIQEGVDQFLTKPITRRVMKQALLDIREKLSAEQEQHQYQERFLLENREYEQYQRRDFLEKMFGGRMSVEEIYEKAGKLGLSMNSEAYNLILFNMLPRQDGQGERDEVACQAWETELVRYFLRFPEYVFSRWSMNGCCVIVKGTPEVVAEYTKKGVEKIAAVLSESGDKLHWHVAAGQVVTRFSALSTCFARVNHIFAARFWLPEQHILTEADLLPLGAGENADIRDVEAEDVNPAILRDFLSEGQEGNVVEFIEGYLGKMREVLHSKIFRNYLALSVCFTVLRFVQKLGIDKEAFLNGAQVEAEHFELSEAELPVFMEKLLTSAIRERDCVYEQENQGMVEKALAYIDAHFTDETLSLTRVAQVLGVSASYFSGEFSRARQQTFVEYITEKRMTLARELLTEKRLSTQETAQQVGYKDAHYFSFVFKKTQGMSPREFRSREIAKD